MNEAIIELLRDDYIYGKVVLHYLVHEAVAYFALPDKALYFLLAMAKSEGINTQITERAFYKVVNCRYVGSRDRLHRNTVRRRLREMVAILDYYDQTFLSDEAPQHNFVMTNDVRKMTLHRIRNEISKKKANSYNIKWKEVYYKRFVEYYKMIPHVLNDEEYDTLLYVFNRLIGLIRWLDTV